MGHILQRTGKKAHTKPDTDWTAASPWVVLSRLVRERWRRFAWRYAIALLLMSVASGATALSAWMMKDVVNDVFVHRDQSAMTWLPIAIAVLFIVKGIASYCQEVWLSRIGNQLVAEYQSKIYDHLLRMNVTFFETHSSADLIMRTSRAAAAARSLLNLVAVSVGRDLLTLAGLIIVMVTQDPVMSLVVLVAGPIAALAVRQMGNIVRKSAQVEAATSARTIGVIKETAQGVRLIKSFQLEPMFRERQRAAVATMQATANRVAKVRAGVNPLIETLGGLSVGGVVAYTGWQMSAGGLQTPGHLIAFITALLLAADPARRLSRFHIEMRSHAVGVGLMFEILDTPVTEDDSAAAPALVVKKGEVRFDRVNFSYIDGKPILKDVSLTARGGEATALVGPSGGGKSTIFGLLQGFWTPAGGQVSIDGQPMGSVSLASWRESISVVGQDVFLFEGTVRENLLAVRPNATQAEVEAATRAAHAHDFIMQLPNGYDTSVGELGNMVSGGQRQRISIARAFLKDAPILLLDEPTSALDSETEKIIQEALAELMSGRTTLVIAHRFATVRHAQRIFVIDQGCVVEAGTHDELMAMNGSYARLYRLQFMQPEVA